MKIQIIEKDGYVYQTLEGDGELIGGREYDFEEIPAGFRERPNCYRIIGGRLVLDAEKAAGPLPEPEPTETEKLQAQIDALTIAILEG